MAPDPTQVLRRALVRFPLAMQAARWLKSLFRPPPPRRYTLAAGQAAAPKPGPQRILVSDGRIPRPDESAGDLGTFGVLLNLVALGHEVTFLPWELEEEQSPSAERLAQLGVTVITQSDCAAPRDYLKREGKRFSTILLMRFEIAEQLIDVVRRHATHVRSIYCAHDLVFLRAEREFRVTGRAHAALEVKRLRSRELAVMRKAGQTTVMSEFEQDVLRAFAPDVPVSVFPFLSVPVTKKPVPAAQRTDEILFVGSFRHAPNRDGVHWFASECWARIRDRLPNARMCIVGPDAPDDVLALDRHEGIAVLGHVEDLDALLSRARLSIAPLRFGAGIKGKIAYSMGMGTPVVTTSTGAEGLGLQTGTTALIADGSEEFADAVVELFSNTTLNTTIAGHGRRHTQNHFSTEACKRDLERLLGTPALEVSSAPQIHTGLAEKPGGILFFSPFPTHPVTHGNRAMQSWFCERLLHEGPVHFVVLDTPALTTEGLFEMRRLWTSVDVLTFENPMIPVPANGGFDCWYENGLAEEVRELCTRYGVDSVVCNYVFQSKILTRLPPGVFKIIDTHDMMSGRYDLLKRHGISAEFFSCSPRQEARYLNRADAVLAFSQVEADFFNAICGRTLARVVPHLPPPDPLAARDFDGRLIAGVAASANGVNLAAVRDLIAACRTRWGESWPIRLSIAGGVGTMIDSLPANEADLFEHPDIQMMGFVPDMRTFYSRVDVALAPVGMGTGISIKTIEALRYGVPLLTTAAGARGIPVSNGLCQIADACSLVAELDGLRRAPDRLNDMRRASRETYADYFATADTATIRLLHAARRQESERVVGRVGQEQASSARSSRK